MPQPSIQKNTVVTANTMKFFERMFTAFFARHMPDSTRAKPRFMKNTSMPVTSTHTVSAHNFDLLSSAATGSAAVSTAAVSAACCAAAVSSCGVSWAIAARLAAINRASTPATQNNGSQSVRSGFFNRPISRVSRTRRIEFAPDRPGRICKGTQFEVRRVGPRNAAHGERKTTRTRTAGFVHKTGSSRAG